MNWTQQASLQLIEHYKANVCLWDFNSRIYKNPAKKTEVWQKIGVNLGCSAEEAKKKMESLMASFRRERYKERKHNKARGERLNTADGHYEDNPIFVSKWFGYKHMSFLLHRVTKVKNIDDCATVTKVEISSGSSADDDDDVDEMDFPLLYTLTEASADNTMEANDNKYVRRIPPPPPSPPGSKKPKVCMEPSYVEFNDPLETTTAAGAAAAYDGARDGARVMRDDSTIFGEYVATKHRKYNKRVQNVIEHLITNILYKADMGKLDAE